MNEIVSRWTPPPNVRDHTGDPIASDSLFFAPPPPGIGTIRTAHSGQRRSGSALGKPTARKVIGLFTLFGILVGGFLGAGFSGGGWIGAAVGAFLGGGLIGGIMVRREGGKRDCTYVGTEGIARCRHGGNSRCEVFRFADAAELQTAFLGRNMGTNFNFQWRDARGKRLYKIEGGYYGGRSGTDPESVLHFARAAETAWSAFLLPQINAEMERAGCCRFIIGRTLGNRQYAVIRPGALDIAWGARQFHNPAHEIDDVVVHHGLIIIRRRDAREKAINSPANGIFHLSYGVISNVEIFLMLLEQVVGVSYRTGE